jgi:hypothetical protein
MSSATVAGSETCRTRPLGSTTLARPTVRRSQSFLLPRQAIATTASVLPQLGQIVSRGGLIVANTYLVKYPIYSYLFFYGYSVDTYPRRIGYVSISDTYPPRIQALAAVSVLHRLELNNKQSPNCMVYDECFEGLCPLLVE